MGGLVHGSAERLVLLLLEVELVLVALIEDPFGILEAI